MAKQLKIIDTTKQKAKHLKHKASFHFRNLISTKKGRIIAIVGGVIILLAILFAIPFTRYAALGPIVKKDVSITVIDAKTKRPVSNALVALGGKSAQSDKDGVAKLKGVSVGQPGLKVTKQYYESYDKGYTVPVIFGPEARTVELQASGRQVSILITNKVSGDPIANAVVSSEGTKATSDVKGIATIILPPTKSKWLASIGGNGYNSVDVDLAYDPGKTTAFSIVPSGSIYYLSKATGTINVMKSNLDGSDPKVVFGGTGQESDSGTSLLSARDWQYSAFLATRVDDAQQIFLIDASKSAVSVVDEGNATFDFVGWSGHNFVYIVNRITANSWDDKKQALKSFNAETGKLTTIDETAGAGSAYYNYAYQNFNTPYIVGSEVVYLKTWNASGSTPHGGDKTPELFTADPTTGVNKVIKTFPGNSYASMRLYEPQGIYIRSQASSGANLAFYEYEDGSLKTIDTNDTKYNSPYPTYLVSPSGHKTLWYEERDGKNTLLIGDDEGSNTKTIGNSSEFTPYGWYGANDEYILLSKNSSELYIASANKVIGENGYVPLKVTDYHRALHYNGYGSGYGGQ